MAWYSLHHPVQYCNMYSTVCHSESAVVISLIFNILLLPMFDGSCTVPSSVWRSKFWNTVQYDQSVTQTLLYMNNNQTSFLQQKAGHTFAVFVSQDTKNHDGSWGEFISHFCMYDICSKDLIGSIHTSFCSKVVWCSTKLFRIGLGLQNH